MIVDIVIIVIISACVIMGLTRGFAKSLVSMLGFVLTAVLVYLLAKPFAGFLNVFVPFDKWINAPIENWLAGIGKLGSITIGSAEGLQTDLVAAGLPLFIVKLVVPWIEPVLPDVEASATVAQVVAPAITSIVILVISAILLFVIIRIGVAILEGIARKATQSSSVLNFTDKLLGTVVGAAKAYLYISVVLGIVAAMISFTFMAPLKTQLQESKFGRFFYENNLLAEMILGDIILDEKTDAEEKTGAEKNNFAELCAVQAQEKEKMANRGLYEIARTEGYSLKMSVLV